ncbi:hypothetical protein AGMMS49587_04030 [Spirochaetia bacterium]|nr:hypothetical protein AGMMS49587_04030 [Spirochaetia bacterium]
MAKTTQKTPQQTGKQFEHYVISRMLDANLDVYLPVVDDHGVDAVVKTPGGTWEEIQIKGCSRDKKYGNAALFAEIKCDKARPNYWFVFYAERLDTLLLLSSKELTRLVNPGAKGKLVIKFNGKNKEKGEYILEQYEKYITTDFSRLCG